MERLIKFNEMNELLSDKRASNTSASLHKFAFCALQVLHALDLFFANDNASVNCSIVFACFILIYINLPVNNFCDDYFLRAMLFSWVTTALFQWNTIYNNGNEVKVLNLKGQTTNYLHENIHLC